MARSAGVALMPNTQCPMQSPNITILLATYNGEKFISEQIESLLGQTVGDFKLFVCDDFSDDSTFSILQEYSEKYPDRIFVSQNEENSGSAKYNFLEMMVQHKDDYVMLCDQDDVWLPDKIEKSLQKMRELENKHGSSMPLLVHTDLRIVNEKLETISPSYFKTEDINTETKTLNKIIARNISPGCTIMYNKALAEFISFETGISPADIVMHDWWLVLIASAFGEIGTIHDKTVLYRQHSANEVGMVDVKTIRHILQKLIYYEKAKKVLSDTYRQAELLLSTYHNKLADVQIEFLEQFCDIPNHNKFIRWTMICRLGVLKKGILRKISSFIFI